MLVNGGITMPITRFMLFTRVHTDVFMRAVMYPDASVCFCVHSHVHPCMHGSVKLFTRVHIYIYMEWLLKSTHTCTLNPHVYTQFQGYTAYISGMLTAYISGMLACMFACGMPSHTSMIRSRCPNSETERDREREREIERERESEREGERRRDPFRPAKSGSAPLPGL